MKKWMLISVIGLLPVLAACGGDDADDVDGEAEGEAAEAITVEGLNWDFDEETYTIPAGEDVEIEYVDEEGVHGIGIEDTDVDDIQDGETATVNLEEGEYTIFCSVPCGQGHDEMVATLAVE